MENVQEQLEQARALDRVGKHEQALGLLAPLEEEPGAHQEDPGFWARLGELRRRTDESESAIAGYTRAVELLQAAGQLNNALALTLRILRLDPARAEAYLRQGEIAAELGYAGSARDGFVRYAELVGAADGADAAVEALRRCREALPDDAEARRLLADGLLRVGRDDEAVEELRALWSLLRRQGRGDQAAAVREEILELRPDADPELEPEGSREVEESPADGDLSDLALLPTSPTAAAEQGPTELETPREAGLQPTSLATPADTDVPPLEGLEPTVEGFEPTAAGAPQGLPLLDGLDDGRADDRRAPPLGDDDSAPLPLLGALAEEPEAAAPPDAAGEALEDPPAGDVPDLDAVHARLERLREDGSHAELVEALASAQEAFAEAGRFREAAGLAAELARTHPTDVELAERWVESATRAGETRPLIGALLALARLVEPKSADRARALYQRVLALDPSDPEARRALGPAPEAAGATDYVDLGALVMDEGAEETTRFRVDREEPTGDEDEDFSEILSLFRQQLSERIDPGDSASHYDLGVAFKEMGLLDDAIAQLQMALRGGAEPLATLEVLGECFAEKGEHSLAVRVLTRATQIPGAAEGDLIGVHYLLGRCEEALERPDAARGFYERVVAVDIGFRDAAERLDSLRSRR